MSKKKNAQKKVMNELKNQLLVQAERLGIKDDYNPIAMEEMKLDSIRKILGDLYMERANLEYELNMSGTDKKEALIKLERLSRYIHKAEALIKRHTRKFEDLIEKGMGDVKKTRRAVRKLDTARVRVAA